LNLAKKVEKPKPEMTKRQLSRWQQQKRRQRLILIAGIAIIVVVLGVLGVGVYNQWYLGEYKPQHEVLIEVNGVKFDMDYFIKMLKFYSAGASPSDLPRLADQVVKTIEQAELIREEAPKLGFSVSDAEVEAKLKSYNPPLSEDYRDLVRTQLLVSKLLDEYFDKQVPTYADQRHILAMFLESEGQANDVRARLEAGEDFSELASELSLDTTTKDQKGDLGWHPEGILTSTLGTSLVDEYAFSAEAGALSSPIYDEAKTKPVGYWLIKVLERDTEGGGAKVKIMLLGSEQEANEVRAKLEAGEDFAALAKEFSLHTQSKDNGGDFDISKGTMGEAIDDFVFNSELGVLSQPIRDDKQSTTGGYWLVKVTEIDSNRQISDEDRNLLKNDAFTKWVDGLFNDPNNKITSYMDENKRLFAVSHVLQAQNQTGGIGQ
jgi:parvulin-like peptidyl-prolyl isomerase